MVSVCVVNRLRLERTGNNFGCCSDIAHKGPFSACKPAQHAEKPTSVEDEVGWCGVCSKIGDPTLVRFYQNERDFVHLRGSKVSWDRSIKTGRSCVHSLSSVTSSK